MPIHVVFDNPPLEMDEWVNEVCLQTGFTLVDNQAIVKAMGQDEEARKVLTSPGLRPHTADRPKMAPFYRKALEQLQGGADKRAVYSSAWLEYLEDVDAYILDWAEIEKRASTMDSDNAGIFKSMNTQALKDRMKKHIAPGKVLELKGGLAREEKIRQAVDFIRSID